jgi:hypothetical protein
MRFCGCGKWKSLISSVCVVFNNLSIRDLNSGNPSNGLYSITPPHQVEGPNESVYLLLYLSDARSLHVSAGLDLTVTLWRHSVPFRKKDRSTKNYGRYRHVR